MKVIINRNIDENPAIGQAILEAFLDDYSVDELAEDYGTNCLMIEEIIRQTVANLIVNKTKV